MQVEKALLAEFMSWVTTAHHSFVPNGFKRKYKIFNAEDCPEVVLKIKNGVALHFGLTGCQQEVFLKDFCGYIEDGGSVHRHTDPDYFGKRHVRANVLVSKPLFGGDPVVADCVYPIQEGGVWLCNVGTQAHYCTQVGGSKPRVVLSFGYLV